MKRVALLIIAVSAPNLTHAYCSLQPVGTTKYNYEGLSNALISYNGISFDWIELATWSGVLNNSLWAGSYEGDYVVNLSNVGTKIRETNASVNFLSIMHFPLLLDDRYHAFINGTYENMSYTNENVVGRAKTNRDYWASGKLIGINRVTGTGNVHGSARGLTNIPAAECNRLALLDSRTPIILENNGSIYAYLRFNGSPISNNFGASVKYYTPVKLVMPVQIEATPSSLAYGSLNAGSTGSKSLTVKVVAPSGAPHVINFTYASDSGTRENITIDGNVLPYTASRTIGNGQSSRTETFTARLSSTVAGGVRGRLVITTRLT
ncbi:hypothetical protein LK784_004418 [Salmonella enterica]|nr:hypothetical protein [Salmonella enterica]